MPSHRSNLLAQHVRKPKVLEQRDEICKRFMKRLHVGILSLKMDLHPHKESVGEFVRDDVLRKTREHYRTGKWRFRLALKITETETLCRIVVGVCKLLVVRIDRELFFIEEGDFLAPSPLLLNPLLR